MPVALSEGLDIRLNQAVCKVNYSSENVEVSVFNPRNTNQASTITGKTSAEARKNVFYSKVRKSSKFIG